MSGVAAGWGPGATHTNIVATIVPCRTLALGTQQHIISPLGIGNIFR